MSYLVMILDDDADHRGDVKRLMTRRGCQVIEVATGRAATAALAECAPDLVVVDGLLPDTDGLTWIAEQRAADRLEAMVFLSAFWRDPASHHHLVDELGVLAVIHKPIKPRALADRLLELLAQATPADAVAPPDASVEALIAEAAAQYARALPEKIALLRRAIDRTISHPGDATLLKQLRHDAHRLAGTAGAYGFQDVGEAARKLEELAVYSGHGGRVPPVEWARWCSRLERAFHSAALAPVDPATPPGRRS